VTTVAAGLQPHGAVLAAKNPLDAQYWRPAFRARRVTIRRPKVCARGEALGCSVLGEIGPQHGAGTGAGLQVWPEHLAPPASDSSTLVKASGEPAKTARAWPRLCGGHRPIRCACISQPVADSKPTYPFQRRALAKTSGIDGSGSTA